MKLTVLPVTPERWPDLEAVFGKSRLRDAVPREVYAHLAYLL
jgi:hypothetical protein